jgi:hypothetical protein
VALGRHSSPVQTAQNEKLFYYINKLAYMLRRFKENRVVSGQLSGGSRIALTADDRQLRLIIPERPPGVTLALQSVKNIDRTQMVMEKFLQI